MPNHFLIGPVKYVQINLFLQQTGYVIVLGCRFSRGISDDVSGDIKTLTIIIKTLGSFSLAAISFFESVDSSI